MILVAICSFILGGAVVFLYYTYFGKDKETEQKPMVVYKPELVNDKLFGKTKELYKANIQQALDLIKGLLETDYNEYQKFQVLAQKYLEEWEGKI